MEKLIKGRITEHLNANSLINDSQHGFTAGRSCLTNLLTFLESLTSHVDQGLPVDVLYLDFSKAFDKVPHQRLISRLRAHGIGPVLSRWIENWLTDRKQRVKIKGTQSPWTSVTSGVPQGSVLGPKLFTIYINDLDENIKSQILKFADDTKIMAPVSNQEQIIELQEDLASAFHWAGKWQMAFNPGKCKCVHFGHANPKLEYTMGAQKIAHSTEEKDLGVVINQSLSPSHHIATCVSSANRWVGLIKRTYENKSKRNIIALYKSLVRPHLEYCVQAWRPHNQKDIDNLEGVQRRMTKMINGMGEDEYNLRLSKTKLLSLEMRRLRSDLIEVFKIMHNLEGVKREDFFQLRIDTGRRGHSLTILKQHCRLNVRKYFFTHRVVDTWNKMSEDTVNSKTVNRFKNQIDPNEGFMLPSFRPTGTPQPTSGNQWDLVRILVRILVRTRTHT